MPRNSEAKALAVPYKTSQPDKGPALTHFSNLLFSGSALLTSLEIGFLAGLWAVSAFPSQNVRGSFSVRTLFFYFFLQSLFRRLYNSYLEACFFSFPSIRTQSGHEHKLAAKQQDLCGRQQEQLSQLQNHDLMTFLTVTTLETAVYFLIPGFYPPQSPSQESIGAAAVSSFSLFVEKAARLVGNHLVMSFNMYWLHRSCHCVPWLWRVHSIHHWAKHPLSRNTYEDHWLDNFMNAVVGHLCAQILVPLDLPTFLFSHFFRIAESLEKHSGISSRLNLAHQLTAWVLPWAQMPHHHDWHHEGHKGSNFTFSSLGGVWDCAFGTRHEGRSKGMLLAAAAAKGKGGGGRGCGGGLKHRQTTSLDRRMVAEREAELIVGKLASGKTIFSTAIGGLAPVVLVVCAAFYKIWVKGFRVDMDIWIPA
jgi:sterol desaturase/sphingolipid hydroxylase (fatty acid hydroxylase superfamily)